MHGQTLTTKVDVKQLLEILRKNKENHKKIFEESLEGYKKEMEKYLKRMLRMLRAGKRVSHHIQLPVPTNMTSEYTTVIKMLEMHQEKTIQLTAYEFACYVEDKWEWRRNFLLSNSSYSGTAQIMAAQIADDEED